MAMNARPCDSKLGDEPERLAQPMPRLLVVDDDPGICHGVQLYFSELGCEVQRAHDCASAEASFRAFAPDAVILDHVLPDGDALSLLPRLRRIQAKTPIVILTGHGTVGLAVRAMQQGAQDFLAKPVELPVLGRLIERLTGARGASSSGGGAPGEAPAEFDPFAGCSAAIRRLEEEARRIADSDRPILILGETGAGKGTLAQWLHRHGPRAGRPFVALNCAGLRSEFLESELFGHSRGAFTGAMSAKSGLFSVADTGTLFLDEVGDMPLEVQPKLLTAIEEGRFRSLGEVQERRVDVRLIIATHHNLRRRVESGSFRTDLYFRIATLHLVVPPLRERREDIVALGQSLLSAFARETGRGPLRLAPDAMEALRRHPWPGNIRELRNVLEGAVVLSGSQLIRADMLRLGAPHEARRPTLDLELASPSGLEEEDLTLRGVERRHIERVLRLVGGNVDRASALLDVPRSTLYSRLTRYGINPRCVRR